MNGIQNLQKCALGHVIIPKIMAAFRNTRKKITFRAEFQYYEDSIARIHDLEKGNHIGMMTRFMVQLNLPLLESALSVVQTNLIQGLYRVRDVCVFVDRCVNDTIRSYPKDSC